MEDLDFIHLQPLEEVVRGGLPDGASAHVLAQKGETYAIYIDGGREAAPEVVLPEGAYEAEWIDPKSGETTKTIRFSHAGGNKVLHASEYEQDIALRIQRR